MTLSHDVEMGNESRVGAENIERILADIHSARALLVERGAAPHSIAVMGASLGANLVLRYAIEHPGVAAVVLVSPGEEYHGVAIDTSDGDSWKWPMLLMISSGDAYAAATGREMNRTAPGYVELREYDGSAHGTDLLDRSEQANEQVLLWLSQIIGPMMIGACQGQGLVKGLNRFYTAKQETRGVLRGHTTGRTQLWTRKSDRDITKTRMACGARTAEERRIGAIGSSTSITTIGAHIFAGKPI